MDFEQRTSRKRSLRRFPTTRTTKKSRSPDSSGLLTLQHGDYGPKVKPVTALHTDVSSFYKEGE
jgi:hypothetical protein